MCEIKGECEKTKKKEDETVNKWKNTPFRLKLYYIEC